MQCSDQQPAVVLDTNIFVAAGFNRQSDSASLIAAVQESRLRMVWSEATRDETAHILRKIPPLSWREFSPLFRAENRRDDPANWDAFQHIPDPADRKFAALADSAGAVLVTQDEDLLGSREQGDVEILTAGEFLRQWTD